MARGSFDHRRRREENDPNGQQGLASAGSRSVCRRRLREMTPLCSAQRRVVYNMFNGTLPSRGAASPTGPDLDSEEINFCAERTVGPSSRRMAYTRLLKPTCTRSSSFPSTLLLPHSMFFCFWLSPLPLSAPALGSQYAGGNDVKDVNDVDDASNAAVPPHDRDPEPEPSNRGTSLGSTGAWPSTSLQSLTSPVSRLQQDGASQSPPSQPTMPPPPPRATLVLPDAITLDDQADLLRAGGPREVDHTSPKAPGTPPIDDQKCCACGGQSIERDSRSAMSSSRSEDEGGCRDVAPPREKSQPESRQESGTKRSSPVRTRTPRVLKTSRDFAHTIRRVYKVSAITFFNISCWIWGGVVYLSGRTSAYNSPINQ